MRDWVGRQDPAARARKSEARAPREPSGEGEIGCDCEVFGHGEWTTGHDKGVWNSGNMDIKMGKGGVWDR